MSRHWKDPETMNPAGVVEVVTAPRYGLRDAHTAHCTNCGWWGYPFRVEGHAWYEGSRHVCAQPAGAPEQTEEGRS